MTQASPPDVSAVRARVAAYAPDARPAGNGSVWAATALVVAPGTVGPEAVFIQRPERAGDRWAGQMALPGGKRDREDVDALATARREAFEEVGVELPAPVGRLDDVRGRTHRGIVATWVFTLDAQPALRPAADEVAAALWIPLRTLFSAEAAGHHTWAGFARFPAIRYEGYVIWGLTHRIVRSLGRALGAGPGTA